MKKNFNPKFCLFEPVKRNAKEKKKREEKKIEKKSVKKKGAKLLRDVSVLLTKVNEKLTVKLDSSK